MSVISKDMKYYLAKKFIQEIATRKVQIHYVNEFRTYKTSIIRLKCIVLFCLSMYVGLSSHILSANINPIQIYN